MCGLTRNPATIYPNTRGCFSLLKIRVTIPADIRMYARSLISSGISAIFYLYFLPLT